MGVDKIERYGWTVKPERGTYMEIRKGSLLVNRDVYQRDEIGSKALEFAKQWSWIACGTLIVAKRGGQYWVVDGQHRKGGADRRSDIDTLPCLVFEVDEVEREAQAFLDANTNRRPVLALAKFKALLATGDEEAQFIEGAINAAGLTISAYCQSAGQFKAINAAQRIAKLDRHALVRVLTVGADLTHADDMPLQQRMILGLYYLHTTIEGGLDNRGLVKRMTQVRAKALSRGADAAAQYYASGGAKVYGNGMLDVINKGLRNKFGVA